MTPQFALVVSDQPRNRLMMAIEAWPIERVLPEKPGWMELADWINLLVWLILMTSRDEPTEQSWYRLIDKAFEAIRSCLSRHRIVNVDELTLATETVYQVGQTYQRLCPLLYPILSTVYPQIQDGYRIRFSHLDNTGLYLVLTLE